MWLEREDSEKPAKHYQNLGQSLRGYHYLFPGHHYWHYLSHRFLHHSPKCFLISSGV